MPFPLDEKWILATEEKLGVRFPESYRVSMKKLNGGQVKVAKEYWELHPILDRTDLKRIKRTCNDVVHETEYRRSWPGFPVNAFAIAANGYGDHLVFLRDDDNPGFLGRAVYEWSHETGTIHFVASDFVDLKRE